MVVYHGSNVVVEKPRLLHQTRKLDFGAGFYTTTKSEQAISFAHKVMLRTNTNTKYVSQYEFDIEAVQKELNILRFHEPDSEWLDFVYLNRSGNANIALFDIVYGPVANDDVFRTFIYYETGAYTKEQTLEALKIKKLFDQMCFLSETALEQLKYIGFMDLSGGDSSEQ